MIFVDYLIAGLLLTIAACMVFWLAHINQKEKNALLKMLPGNKLHRKHIRKNHIHR